MPDTEDVVNLFKQFSPEQRLYMQFIVENGTDDEKKVEGFARTVNKNIATLQQWVQIPGFWECVAVLTDAALLRARADIYRSLIKAATKTVPNVPAAKLALEILGDYSEGKTKAIKKPTETTYKWMDDESTEPDLEHTDNGSEGLEENTETNGGDREDDSVLPPSSTEGISPE